MKCVTTKKKCMYVQAELDMKIMKRDLPFERIALVLQGAAHSARIRLESRSCEARRRAYSSSSPST
jgi:hypothetical protein